ncbi:hypothetical protein ACSQ67_016988 [Phaseolus vulgaris]
MAEVVKLLTIQTSMVDSEGPKHEASSWNLGAERNEHVELRAAHTLELHGHMLLDDLDMPKTSQQRVKNLYNIVIANTTHFALSLSDDEPSILGTPSSLHDPLGYLDSGASHHLIARNTNLSTKTPYIGSENVVIATPCGIFLFMVFPIG